MAQFEQVLKSFNSLFEIQQKYLWSRLREFPFNSLFEILPWGRWSTGLRNTLAFNSLFEIQIILYGCQDASNWGLSILFLRFLGPRMELLRVCYLSILFLRFDVWQRCAVPIQSFRLSILFLRFHKKICFQENLVDVVLIAFNSLFEIRGHTLKVQHTCFDFFFQFSFWDSDVTT